MKIAFLLILSTILAVTHSVINFRQASKVSEQQLQKDGLLLITESNQDPYKNDQNKHYYVLNVAHKEKGRAYNHMKSISNNIAKYLKVKKIIPDESGFIKSEIKPRYLTQKKKWQFSTIFVIYGSREEISQSQRFFNRYSIQKLSSKPSINFLNKKVITLELFNKAKGQILDFLKQFKDFQIKQLVNIEIKGDHIRGEDAIEEQIEDDFNNDSEEYPENVIDNEQSFHNDYIEAKMLFKVGRKNGQQNSNQDDIEDEDNSNESQTYSEESY